MGSKCEWKDGKFEACKNAYVFLGASDEFFRNTISVNDGFKLRIDYCPFCGADIRKPERSLIVKSGETWVIHKNGINYLWTGTPMTGNPDWIYEDLTGWNAWKSFSEIEKEGLTDEIAKLRPMVVCADDTDIICKLYGIEKNVKITLNRHKSWVPWDTCRLATSHELQEAGS